MQTTVTTRMRNPSVCSVSEEVHSVLIELLKEKHIPKKKRSATDIAAYRLKQKRCYTVSTITNPLTGCKEERVMINDAILLKTIEVQNPSTISTRVLVQENCTVAWYKSLLECLKDKYRILSASKKKPND